MGNVCSCCENQEEQKPLLGTGYVGVRTGTLTQHTSGPVYSQPESYTSQGPATNSPSSHSARQNPVKHRDFETSIELIAKVELQTIQMAEMDKMFKDIARLYNEVVENFGCLETEIHKFKEYFVEETHGIPVLDDCVKILMQRVGQATINIDRKSKTYIELIFDAKEVRRMCIGDEERAVMPLEHFSRACRHIRDILAHAPQVESNSKIILQDDEKLRKDIMKSDLSGDEMQKATKAFMDNVSKLRVIAAGTDTIKRDAEKKFKEFSRASQGFFRENE